MGAAVYGMYQLLMNTINSNVVATTGSIVIGVVVYGILLLILGGLREKELRSFPMGNLIIRVAKKLRLMR